MTRDEAMACLQTLANRVSVVRFGHELTSFLFISDEEQADRRGEAVKYIGEVIERELEAILCLRTHGVEPTDPKDEFAPNKGTKTMAILSNVQKALRLLGIDDGIVTLHTGDGYMSVGPGQENQDICPIEPPSPPATGWRELNG